MLTAVDATVQAVNICIQSDNTSMSLESLIINSILVIVIIKVGLKYM